MWTFLPIASSHASPHSCHAVKHHWRRKSSRPTRLVSCFGLLHLSSCFVSRFWSVDDEAKAEEDIPASVCEQGLAAHAAIIVHYGLGRSLDPDIVGRAGQRPRPSGISQVGARAFGQARPRRRGTLQATGGEGTERARGASGTTSRCV